MRILHTSDWHLGSRFFGRSLLADQAYLLDQMINLARDLHPDVMLVAGDIFEQRRPNEEALALFHDTVGRLLDLGTTLVMVSGPSDDFANLHLSARWVRQQGLYLFSDPSQVLSPLTLQGQRDNFSVSFWCLPYALLGPGVEAARHPAQLGRSYVETVVQRIDPGTVNVFAGYAWAQGVGKRAELGALVSPGGQPIEKRLLEYFDYVALGGSHQPVVLGPETVRYSGGLLGTELETGPSERSVTQLVIEGKGKLSVEEFPLRPRRAFRVLAGSAEELLRQSQQHTGDLLVLRSQEAELSVEQKQKLRSLGPHVVSVEIDSPLQQEPSPGPQGEDLSPLLALLREFHSEVGGEPWSAQTLELLRRMQERL